MKFKKKTIEKCSHEANNLGKNLLEKMKFSKKQWKHVHLSESKCTQIHLKKHKIHGPTYISVLTNTYI